MILNISFGIFAFLPQGWLFMIFVMLIEGILLTKILNKTWFNQSIFFKVVLSNLTSGIIGIVISFLLNGGWWLIFWIPWVSKNEVKLSNPENVKWLILYYAFAFILTVIFESIFNVLALKKQFKTKQILHATLIVNIISYLVGSILLYSYSFSG